MPWRSSARSCRRGADLRPVPPTQAGRDEEAAAEALPPGTARPQRFLPRFHWELLACGVGGHLLVGTDAAEITPGDRLVVREIEGLRWHRCLRCDSWLALEPPAEPVRRYPPAREEIELPLRGRPLRDKFILRLIAVDKTFRFLLKAKGVRTGRGERLLTCATPPRCRVRRRRCDRSGRVVSV